jgi:hypothetical protein
LAIALYDGHAAARGQDHVGSEKRPGARSMSVDVEQDDRGIGSAIGDPPEGGRDVGRWRRG